MKSAMWRSLAIDVSTACAPVCAASFVGRAFHVFQGTDLTGFAGDNLVAWPVQSGCLSFGSLLTTVRRQSATRHRLVAGRPAAASAPSAKWQATSRLHPAVMATGHHCLAFSKVTLKLRAIAARCMATKSRHNGWLSIQGAAIRFAIKFTARASGLNPSSTSRPGLTGRSTGRLPASLATAC